MARLYEKGNSTDPAEKAKSVMLTEDGMRESRRGYTRCSLASPTEDFPQQEFPL